jgi:hypothetical protein
MHAADVSQPKLEHEQQTGDADDDVHGPLSRG